MDIKIIHFAETGSTNAIAKDYIKSDKRAPFCILADRQTHGYGRYGKSFYSPMGGLYMTLVVSGADFDCDVITRIVGEKLLGVLSGCAKNLCIKGVNDIFMGGKKIAGVLVEKVKQCFVIGIGINLKQTEPVPDGLRDIMGFLDVDADKNELVNRILQSLVTNH